MNSPQQLRKRRNADKGGTSGDATETGTGSASGAGAGAGATAAATSHHDALVPATPKQDPQQQQQQQPQQQSWKFWLRVLKCGRVAAFRLVLLATAIVVYVHIHTTNMRTVPSVPSSAPVPEPCLPCTLPCANQHECLTVCWRPNVSPHHRRSRAKEGHRHAVLVCRVAGWLGLPPSHLYMAASLPGSLRLWCHRAITAVSMLCCHANCPSAPLHAHPSL